MSFPAHIRLIARSPHNAARVVRGLAPTPAILGATVNVFANKIYTKMPQHAPTVQRAAVKIGRLLNSGGTPVQFARAQARFGAALEQLSSSEMQAVLAAAGFAGLPHDHSTADPFDAEMARVMLCVDASAGLLLTQLQELVAIRSVSHTPLPNPHVLRSAQWVARAMKDAGLQTVRLLKARGANPSVYGEIIVDRTKPTVWLYAHHDVQPVGEGWESAPWKAVVSGDRVYGRGAADDKAGFISALAMVKAYRDAGKELPVNVVFFVEGEEEIGSPNLARLLKKIPNPNPSVVLLIDSKNVLTGQPTISLATRGATNFILTVRTAEFASHCGINSHVPNALLVIQQLIAALADDNGRLHVPGLTENPPPLPERISLSLNMLPADEVERVLRLSGGILDGLRMFGDPDRSPVERIPGDFAISPLAMASVQTMERVAGQVSHWAEQIVNIRIPPGVDLDIAQEKITARLHELATGRAEIDVNWIGEGIKPWLGHVNHPYTDLLGTAFALGYGKPAVYDGCGGSIGFLSIFNELFPDVPLYPVGVEDPFTNAHAANESLSIDDLLSTARSFVAFLELLGQKG